jgi:hypothetical protein
VVALLATSSRPSSAASSPRRRKKPARVISPLARVAAPCRRPLSSRPYSPQTRHRAARTLSIHPSICPCRGARLGRKTRAGRGNYPAGFPRRGLLTRLEFCLLRESRVPVSLFPSARVPATGRSSGWTAPTRDISSRPRNPSTTSLRGLCRPVAVH